MSSIFSTENSNNGSLFRSGSVRSVSALSPIRQTTQTPRKRSTAIPVARRAKGRRPKSAIPVRQSLQTKQVQFNVLWTFIVLVVFAKMPDTQQNCKDFEYLT